MTSTTPKVEQPLIIHAGKIILPGKGSVIVLLRKLAPEEYRWFEYFNDEETPTNVAGINKEEAIQNARKAWVLSNFCTLNCGFKYTLPERDEHGMNALFYQMKASLQSFNGIYFDEEMGHNCFVQNASQEARDLMLKLKDR